MKTVQVDNRALLAARASAVLAVDHAVFARGVSVWASRDELVAAASQAIPAPSSVGVVLVAGPLAQRGIETLCGYVDGYDFIEARFGAALEDPSVGSVLLLMDSPGGDVAGLEEAVSRMSAAKKKSGKKCIVYVDEMAASAAYWIASAIGDEVIAPRAAMVGSIGCIGALVDETAALEQDGVKVTLIREPAGKADSHPAGPVEKLAEERARSMVRSAAERFFAAVADTRGLTAKKVEALNGAMLEAPAALAAGLIDAVGGRDEALARARAALTENMMDDKKKPSTAAATSAPVEALEVGTLIAADPVLTTAAAVTGKSNPDEIVGALHALAQKAARVDAVEAQLVADKTAREAAEKAAIVKSLVADRKVTKTQLEAAWFTALSLDGLKSYAETAQSHAPAHVPDSAVSEDSIPVDAETERLLGRLGLTKDDYRKAVASGAV